MQIDVEVMGETAVVRVGGELDLREADAFRRALEGLLADGRVKHLVLNLEGLAYIDSSGLGVILGRYRALHRRGGRISLVGLRPQVRRIMELSGILRIMPEFGDEATALATGV
ncbi:MAG: STAS domain-containing protein [Desulfotomaculales bacterium]